MKRLILLLFLCVSFIGIPYESTAQNNRPFGFHFKKIKKKNSYCSFELKANLIVVKVLIDDSDTLNFILDSGVRSIIVLDTSLRSQLVTGLGRTINITGYGKEDQFKAFVSVGHTFKIGQIIGYNQNVVFLEDDLLRLSEFVGMKIHGIVGADLFDRFSVKIDYGSNELVFEDPIRYKYKKRKGHAMELHIEKSKPYINLNEVTIENMTQKNLRLVIDTGGAHALLLNTEALPDEFIPKVLFGGNLGHGLNGKIDGQLGRVKSMKFAGQNFKDIIGTFPDSTAFGTINNSEEFVRQGSIGGEILRRFIVTINYSQKLIVLKPIRKLIHKPFDSDMSGLDIRAIGDKFDEFEIVDVIPNTPADIAGLITGDRIVFFNKKLARNVTINDIYKALCEKEGDRIDMIILRGNRLEEINFKLKKII